MNTGLYLLARKIHRTMVLVMVVLIFIMSPTGAIMKFPEISKTFSFINPLTARYIHNQVSPFFSIALMIMLLTGGYMYLFTLPKKTTDTTSKQTNA